jgi:hypothetical protein
LYLPPKKSIGKSFVAQQGWQQAACRKPPA